MRKFGMNSVIASIAKQSLLALFLSIALIACGGDSGTSAPSDEPSCCSKTVSSSSNSDSGTKSGMTSSSQKTVSSSSVKTTSSSSVAPASSSSKKVESSSSQKVASSSSSVKTVSSSSSVIPASSGNLPSSSSKKEGESSSAMTSSSSSSKKVESSSSEYVPFDHSKTHAADWEIGENRYKTFVDPRNGRSYYYITIPGRVFKEMGANGKAIWTEDTVTVMAENLNVGKMVLGENDQNDDGEIERYCYNNDTTYCDEFGGLYQWAEMMQLPSRCNTESCAELIQENHRGICPEGWRLMTYDDYKIIENADGNEEHGIAGLRSGYRFSGYNTTGFSLVGAGLRTANGGFDDLLDVVYWVYPEEHEYDVAEYAYAAYVARDSDDGTGTTRNRRGEKKSGYVVRCVKLE